MQEVLAEVHREDSLPQKEGGDKRKNLFKNAQPTALVAALTNFELRQKDTLKGQRDRLRPHSMHEHHYIKKQGNIYYLLLYNFNMIYIQFSRKTAGAQKASFECAGELEIGEAQFHFWQSAELEYAARTREYRVIFNNKIYILIKNK